LCVAFLPLHVYPLVYHFFVLPRRSYMAQQHSCAVLSEYQGFHQIVFASPGDSASSHPHSSAAAWERREIRQFVFVVKGMFSETQLHSSGEYLRDSEAQQRFGTAPPPSPVVRLRPSATQQVFAAVPFQPSVGRFLSPAAPQRVSAAPQWVSAAGSVYPLSPRLCTFPVMVQWAQAIQPQRFLFPPQHMLANRLKVKLVAQLP